MIITAGTGHRPDKLGGYSRQAQIRLHKFALETLRSVPTDKLISGMAQGWDQALAWAAKEMGIPFTAAVPFIGQERLWPQEAQDRYTSLLSYAEGVEVICDYNHPGAMSIRNSWMVDNCSHVLALFNGSPGGTKN